MLGRYDLGDLAESRAAPNSAGVPQPPAVGRTRKASFSCCGVTGIKRETPRGITALIVNQNSPRCPALLPKPITTMPFGSRLMVNKPSRTALSHLRTLQKFIHLILGIKCEMGAYNFHFTDEETEAWRGYTHSLKS